MNKTPYNTNTSTVTGFTVSKKCCRATNCFLQVLVASVVQLDMDRFAISHLNGILYTFTDSGVGVNGI